MNQGAPTEVRDVVPLEYGVTARTGPPRFLPLTAPGRCHLFLFMSVKADWTRNVADT